MSLPRYPAYRYSGVLALGCIPSHWDVLALKRFARLTYGDSLPSDERAETGEIPVFGSNGPVGVHSTANTFAPAILVGRKGSFGTINWSENPVFAIDTVYYINQADAQCCFRWFFWTLQTAGLNVASQDTGVPGLSREYAYSTRLPCPPIAEQRAVASFLDRETAKIDGLVAEQERLIALLNEKRQAVISHAVTKGLDSSVLMKDSGIEWLGELPAHWGLVPLKRVWTVIDCKHVTAEFVDDGVPLASIREVQSEYVNLQNAKHTTQEYYELLISDGREPCPGDLIFSRNATVGEVAQVSEQHPPFAMGQDVCLFKKIEQSVSSDFYQHVLKSSIVTEQLGLLMIGSTFKRVNVDDIRNLQVPRPPDHEQKAIAEKVKDVSSEYNSLIEEATKAIGLLREHRTALVSAAVTGQIDVRGLVDEEAAA